MSPGKARAPAQLCRVCLTPFAASIVKRSGGTIPIHHVTLPDDSQGPRCRGSATPPREPGQGRSHYVIT